MSRVLFTAGTVPSTPAAGKIAVYTDTADSRVKAIDANGVISSLSDAAGRNVVINGGFDVALRQVLTTVTVYSQTASRIYGPDRWFFSNENASVDYAAVDTAGAQEANLTARYYGRIRKITALGKFLMGQIVEGINTAPLRGRYVRLSCKMRYTPNAMTVRLGLAQLQNAGTLDTVPGWVSGAPSGTFVSAWGAAGTDPTLGTNVALITPTYAEGGTISGSAVSCVLTTAFVRYSGVFLVPTNAKNLIPMIWTNGQPAINDIVHISEVSMSDGMELLDWTPRLISDAIPLMQRYYYKTFPSLTAPAQSAGLTGASGGAGVLGAVANTMTFRYPVTMRAAPTHTFYNPSAANAFVRNVPRATDATATSATNIGDGGFDITCTGLAAWLAGERNAVHFTADSEI